MYMYMHMYICKCLYNIYGLSDRWDASHWLSLSPGPQLVSAPSRYQLLPYSSTQREQEWNMVMVMVSSAVDGEQYEGQVVWTVRESNQQCVSIPKYKAL